MSDTSDTPTSPAPPTIAADDLRIVVTGVLAIPAAQVLQAGPGLLQGPLVSQLGTVEFALAGALGELATELGFPGTAAAIEVGLHGGFTIATSTPPVE